MTEHGRKCTGRTRSGRKCKNTTHSPDRDCGRHTATSEAIEIQTIDVPVDSDDTNDSDPYRNPIQRMFAGEKYRSVDDLHARIDYVQRNALYEASPVLSSFSRKMDIEAVETAETTLQYMADGVHPLRGNVDFITEVDLDDEQILKLFRYADNLHSKVLGIKRSLRRAHDARLMLDDAVTELRELDAEF